MKKVFSILAGMCIAVVAMAETDFTFTSDADKSQTKDGISIELAIGSGSKAPEYSVSFNEEINPSEMRLYLGNTITISSSTALTNIQMVFAKTSASGKEYAGLSASTGTLTSGGQSEGNKDWKVDSWTGSATTVEFTTTGKGQRKISRILIDGAPIVIVPDEDAPLPTEADLDNSYVYPEPTIVGVKDTTILKKEYAFIWNNVLVHCTKGSILKENTTEGSEYPAYFNVNEYQDMTFTATQAFERVEIDGYIRKAFVATCDKGKLTSKSDPDEAVTDDNVVVISGIKSKSVTIHCNDQVRCFKVRIFFKEDSTGIDEWTNGEGANGKWTKAVRNGQIYIIRGGKTYTILGATL